MTNSVNSIHLIGRVGQDPEIKYTKKNNTPVMTISVATKDYKDNTSWHRVVLWDKRAEYAYQHLKKGDQIYVDGRLEYREWSQGEQKHVSAEIIAHNCVRLASPDRGSTGRTEAPRDYVEPNGNVKDPDESGSIPF